MHDGNTRAALLLRRKVSVCLSGAHTAAIKKISRFRDSPSQDHPPVRCLIQ